MSAHDIILFSSFAETSLSQCHYLKPPLWKGGLAPKLPTDQKTRPNTNILVLSVLQPVASNLGEHLDAFGEATAQPLDIIVLVDVIATALVDATSTDTRRTMPPFSSFAETSQSSFEYA